MSPCQQAIQVQDLHIEFVVSLWPDCNYAVGANCPDVRRLSRTRPSDIFVLSRTCMRVSSLICGGGDEDGGDDQEPK